MTNIEPKAKAKPKQESKPKHRILRWKGVLAEGKATVRIMVVLVLLVASVALAFTQLGFVAVGGVGNPIAYVIALLIPVTFGALLLGVLWGTVIGFFTGVVLFTHATTVPLDFYELAFITPFSSIVMLTVAGLLLGLSFAFALRNNPQGAKRIVYIVIVCTIISILYSLVFVTSVVVEIVIDAARDYGENVSSEAIASLQERAISTVLGMGSVTLQIVLDALLMSVLSCIGDVVVRFALARRAEAGLRSIFGAWLAAVVFIAFMIISTAGFAVITGAALTTTANNMERGCDYLLSQVESSDNRSGIFVEAFKNAGGDFTALDDASLERLLSAFESESILSGYTEETDGIVFITAADRVYLTDSKAYSDIESLEDGFDEEVIEAIDRSKSTGSLQRVVYSKEMDYNENDPNSEKIAIPTELGYLMAKERGYYTVIMIQPSSMVFAERAAVMAWVTVSSFILLFVVFVLIGRLLESVVARRIDETNKTLARITQGELDQRVSPEGTREFRSLSSGINQTVDTLQGWISEAETRMDSELAAAKSIQEASLPRIFPPYPDIRHFDIYASMQAAREVGGDFYDFFFVGDDHTTDTGKLGFVIADVSGKGVPAALFMMKAMAEIRDYLESGMETGEAIENVNHQLCGGNDAGMFVTVWAGVLDYASGHVEYVNAGHNPPLLWQHKEGWHWVQGKSGLPLGLFDGMPYEAFSVECKAGETFLLYTDGVTEAMNSDEELYGDERLMSLATRNPTLHPRALVDCLRRDVETFADGAQQSDDITILALEVGVPPELTASITVAADIDELPRVNEFIHTELDHRLCPARVQGQLDIAVEELFVNVAHYAYPDATPEQPGMVRVNYTYSAEPPSITVDIIDEGVPYNPLEKPDAVTPDDIADVPIGGLGILMAKRSVDKMSYEHVGSSNIVTIFKKW